MSVSNTYLSGFTTLTALTVVFSSYNNRTWLVNCMFSLVAKKMLDVIFACIIAVSLEAAYSLNWGAREIWGRVGETYLTKVIG